MSAKRVKLERILMPEPVSAGMNVLVLMSLVYMFRSTTEDAPPIHIAKEGRHYRIVDGRHRFVASHISGRRTVLAEVVK